MPHIHTLIILPCHSIYLPPPSPSPTSVAASPLSGPGSSPSDWALQSFQLESQDQISFLYHISAAINLLKQDLEGSRLVISGGYTKSGINKSESASYLQVARERGLLTGKSESGIFLEEYARDSFENVLFSLCLFKNRVGSWPRFVKVVGFEFKRYRFLQQHLKALRFPLERVEYIGIGPIYPEIGKGEDEREYEERKRKFFEDLERSEKRNAVDLFEKDPFGEGEVLGEKKRRRDPYGRGSSEESEEAGHVAKELLREMY